MCCLYKRRLGKLDPPFDEFVHRGSEYFQKLNYVDGIHRKPELLIPYSTIYYSMHECDVDLENLKEVIQSMLDFGLPIATEDNPYRKMEMRYALQKGCFDHPLPPLQTLFRSSSLYEVPPALFLRLDDVYSLTHIIFYLTDFGFSKSRNPNLVPLRGLISTLLGMYTLERNWDVVAELLLCCNFLNYFPLATYLTSWSSLIQAQKTDGSLTDTFFSSEKYEKMDVREKDRYYFEQHYHTTQLSAAVAFLTDDGNIIKRDTLGAKPRYSLPDCGKPIEKAYNWILRTYDDQSERLSLSSLLHVLLGQWIWSNFVGDHYLERSQNSYMRIHDKIQRLISSSPASVNACDPALVLLAEAILRGFNLRVADFELFARSSFDSLCSADNSKPNRALDLFPVSYLLQSMGFQLDMRSPEEEREILPFDCGIGVSEDTLRAIVNYISTATSFGSRHFRAYEPQIVDNVRANLTALAYYYLHKYRLDEGFMLIRAMNHSGMKSWKCFREAVDFMLAQQRKDGSFGFYRDEIELIRKSEQGFDPLDKIILPITVSAMWTLAEATTDGFSLFNSVRTIL